MSAAPDLVLRVRHSERTRWLAAVLSFSPPIDIQGGRWAPAVVEIAGRKWTVTSIDVEGPDLVAELRLNEDRPG